jgi:hypothetical protein
VLLVCRKNSDTETSRLANEITTAWKQKLLKVQPPSQSHSCTPHSTHLNHHYVQYTAQLYTTRLKPPLCTPYTVHRPVVHRTPQRVSNTPAFGGTSLFWRPSLYYVCTMSYDRPPSLCVQSFPMIVYPQIPLSSIQIIPDIVDLTLRWMRSANLLKASSLMLAWQSSICDFRLRTVVSALFLLAFFNFWLSFRCGICQSSS